MKKLLKIAGIGLSVGLIGASFCAPFIADTDMTSITRPYEKTEYTYIGEPSVPLNEDPTLTSLDIEIINVINDEREEVNLKPYDYNSSLGEAAHTRAEECEQLFSHTRPDGSKWYTVNQNVCFGENLAYGYDNAEDVVDAWLNSPTHRDLLYDNEFETCGIGHHEGADGTTYIACEFGY